MSHSKPGTAAGRSVRVRSRPLDQIDEAKLALALVLMAKRLRETSKTADAVAIESEPPSRTAASEEAA